MAGGGDTAGGWGALKKHRDLRLFCIARLSANLSSAMQNVAVGWFVYDLTHSAMDLGLTGLFTFLPMLALALVTGHVADTYDRRLIVAISSLLSAAVSFALLAYSMSGNGSVNPIFVLMVLIGTARAFGNPAYKALLPNLVPREDFANAVAWSSSFEQFANTAGPAIGGLLYFFGAQTVFGVAFGLYLIASVAMFMISARPEPVKKEKPSFSTITAGLRHIYAHKVIFGSISLDMVAVCVGGVTALLPIFSDALHAGPWGVGFLRSAQAIGALVMASVLTRIPVKRGAGPKMMWSVAAYGAAIATFGLSNNIFLSIFALFMVGASDQVSVFVRHTIVQTDTPDNMRGRVSAVNVIFVGASGSLGEFESGLAATLVGPIYAVILGGVGAMVFAGLWAWMFPALRARDELVPKDSVGMKAPAAQIAPAVQKA